MTSRPEESLTERQEDELQVLQAVYMDDAKDLRQNDAWKVKRPPEIQLTLRPQESMHENETHVQVDLFVKCTADYPNRVPELRLDNAKGLSNQQLKQLEAKVKELAEENVGEVMILEVAQFIQKFLHEHNKPGPKSFYDEMIFNKKKLEEKQALEYEEKIQMLKKKEEKERQNIEREIERRQEALKQEGKRRREEARRIGIERSSWSGPGTPDPEVAQITPIPQDSVSRRRLTESPDRKPGGSRERRRSLTRRTSTPKCQDEDSDTAGEAQTHIIVFNNRGSRTIHCGKCLGQSCRGKKTYVGMDTSSGNLVCVAEWVLKWRHVNRRLNIDAKEEDCKEAAKYIKQVFIVEQEINTLVKLKHKNLVRYQDFQYQQEAGKITVSLLLDYVSGTSLDQLQKKKLHTAMQELRFITSELLEALAYLHNKAIVHKDLRASSVFVDNECRVRLGDYSVDRRMSDLFLAAENALGSQSHIGVEVLPVMAKGSLKGDIYQLGVLVLSLSVGEQVQDCIPNVPDHLPEELQDFISKCIMTDEKKRWSAHQLLDHRFIKSPVYRPLTGSQIKKSRTPDQREEQVDPEADETSDYIPFIPTGDLAGQSRLHCEFDVLQRLGKGGFGDVIKVKNKLDGRYYAIKRIPLNPKSKQFSKKITREVKLLSRLNHENVVRYYNSWIEITDKRAESEESSTVSETPPSQIRVTPPDEKPTKEKSGQSGNSLGFTDNIEKLAPPAVNDSVEWSMSFAAPETNLEDSSSEEEDEGDVFGTSFLVHSQSSDNVIFGGDENSEIETSARPVGKVETKDAEEEADSLEKLQFLYIQMEFCEKSTLRNSIDMGLYQDSNRVWRLFREIVEGLVHIHEQGMIHRDLKPTNIFLDSNDHVKIGDFGLATTNLFQKQGNSLFEMSLNPAGYDMRNLSSMSDLDQTDLEAMTGRVGTALYVSPEVMMGGSKTRYSQKVDMFSLGVMFFEMCYKPLPTGMERVAVLGRLRMETTEFPADFDTSQLKNEAHVIQWLLNHDPDKRPTSLELLQSEYLPPPQMEEAELNEMLRSMLADNRSKPFKHLMSAIFTRSVQVPDDVLYDLDFYKGPFSEDSVIGYQSVQEYLRRLFSRHGAVELKTPLLMPKCELYDNQEQYMCVMDQHGGLVALPYDLRVPFARYAAKSGMTNFKRYSIERVYRDKKWSWVHPRMLTECAFDIITPNVASLIPEAELIYLIQEIISDIPVLQEKNYVLLLNHAFLLKSVLLHCGVEEEKHCSVYAIMEDKAFKSEKQRKNVIQEKLLALGLTENTMIQVYTYMTKEGPFGKMASWLRCITKTGSQAASYAKKALHEMEAMLNHTEIMGCKFQPTLILRPLYNWQVYSGVMFQIGCEVQRKRGVMMEILAAGGRYDQLLEEFQMPKNKGATHKQFAAGVSIAFEKLVAAFQKSETMPVLDIMVCSVGHKPLVRERLCVIRDLWAAGLRADIWADGTQDLEEIQDICKAKNVNHIVILKDGDAGFCKIRSLEKDRFLEKKVNNMEIVEYLQQKIHATRQESPESTAPASKGNLLTSQQSVEQQHQAGSSSSSLPQYNITFLQPDNNRLASNAKRRYEAQIYTTVSPVLQNLSSKSRVEVIALDLDVAVLKTISAHIELGSSEGAFEASIGNICDKHQRHRKYLTKITDHLHNIKYEKTNSPVIILYGLKDDTYRVIL